MGSFQIRTTQPAREIRFASSAPSVLPQDSRSTAEPTEAPGNVQQAVPLQMTARPASSAPASDLNLFETRSEADAGAFRERLSTRQSQLRVGPEQVQLELGLEADAPEILTADRDPDLAQTLKARFGNGRTAAQSAASEQILRTGARLQPHEGIELQLGMVSAVPTEQIGLSKAQLSALGDLRPGVYAGMGVQMAGFSSRLAVDTVHGKPRTEFGTAIQAGESATVGLSFLHQAHVGTSALRLGTELKATQDTVLGVNLNQPLDKTDTRHTAVGVYLNTRFR